jgi:glycosyltransferase involved in cell wall biosynthesis
LKELLDKNEAIRTKALKNANITFVPISNWVKEKADASAIIGDFPKQIIHNGLDFSVFKATDKGEARALFKLPKDKKIVLLGSDISMYKRKGIQLAIEALEQLDHNIFQPVIFGMYTDELPSNFIRTGYIKDESKLAALYSAADLFCMSSIEEAFGQVTIEALACGIPVVSFSNGGSLDIILPGVNGILAEGFSSEALAEALKKAAETVWDSEAIIRDTDGRFNIENKIEAYIQLYEAMLPI